MTTIYNTEPYFDDFSASKNYVRILFKPGVAVQARELTQLQTAIQEQIKAIGGFLFKNESLVSGGVSNLISVDWLEITAEDIPDPTAFINKNIIGSASGARAYVTHAVSNSSDRYHRLYFTYMNGKQFATGDIVSESSIATTGSGVFQGSTGKSLLYTVERSVFYVNGFFVVSEQTSIIVGDGSTTASAKLGYKITENIVTYQDDETLLDNALGSPNYAAPGADRISIKLDLVSYPYSPAVDAAAENMVADTTDNFIELARVDSGNLIQKNTTQSLGAIEDILARRTFDESGDYTTTPFIAKVSNSPNDSEKLRIKISPGKAYVKGYEFKTSRTLDLDLPKARESVEIQNRATLISVGDYIIINSPTGNSFDFTSNQTVNLRNQSNVVVGTAMTNWVQYHAAGKYKLFVSSVKMTDAINSITNIEKLGFTATVDTTSGVLFKAASTSFVIPVGYSPVKRMIDVSYTAQFMVETTSASTTLLQPNSISSNLQYISQDIADYVVVNTTTDTIVQITSATANNQSLSIGGAFTIGNVYQIYTKVYVQSGASRVKTLATKTIYVANSTAGNISIGIADVYKIKQIHAIHSVNNSPSIDVTNRYALDNGQKDYVYDYAQITLNKNQKSVSTAERDVLKIELEYFQHTGDGYLSVDSYSSIGYENIPAYRNQNGEVVSLRDAYDFRPVRTINGAANNSSVVAPLLPANVGSSVYTGSLKPVAGDQIIYDLEYYIGRIDKLVVTKERYFDLIKGISQTDPEAPADMPSAMTIYVINVPAYTFTPESVKLSFIDNRRYTMKDISKIDKRVERLEYYTSMSLLEKQAADEIVNDSTGLEKFKSGFLVDPFSGFGVADVGSSEFAAQIDTITRTLRPRFNSTNLEFAIAPENTSVAVHGDIVTLPYTTTPFVINTLATSWTNLMPYMVFEWNGEMKLSPATDTWVDKGAPVEVVSNLNGENDPYTILKDKIDGTTSSTERWDEHRLISKGVDVNDKSYTTAEKSYVKTGSQLIENTLITEVTDITRTTTATSISTGLITEKSAIATITNDLGNKVVDASIIPYIRARTIDFAAIKIMPETRLFASFDNVDVTRFCFQYPFFECAVPAGTPTEARILGDGNSVGDGRYRDPAVVVLSAPSAGAYIKMGPDVKMFKRGDILEWKINGTWVSTGLPITDIIPGSNNLESNIFGMVAGYFNIPSSAELRFPVGDRVFKIADSLGKSPRTSAETRYIANGLQMSLQRDILATRVQAVSLKPISEITIDPSTTREYDVKTRTVPRNVTIPCGGGKAGNGISGRWEYDLELGTDTGLCGVNYDPTGIPDRYSIVWNGNTYTSGFVGYSEYDRELQKRGFPATVKFAADGTYVSPDAQNALQTIGKLRFNKTEYFPTVAKLIVDAPLPGSLWRYKIVCPGTVNDLEPESMLVGQLSAPSNIELARGTLTVNSQIQHVHRDFIGQIILEDNIQTFKRKYFYIRYYPNGSVDHGLNEGVREDLYLLRFENDNGNTGVFRHGLYAEWSPLNSYVIDFSVDGGNTFAIGTPLVLKSFTTAQQSISYTYPNPNAYWDLRGPTLTWTGEPFNLKAPRVQINGSAFETAVYPLKFKVGDTLKFDCPLLSEKPEWREADFQDGRLFDLNYKAVFALEEQWDGDFFETSVTDTTTVMHSTVNSSATHLASIIVYWDPIAQSFIVENHPEGLFIKAVDLYFRNKGTTFSDGVTVQIRPMVNGYPQSADVLPFASTFKYSDEIVTQLDTDQIKLATRFEFDTPIYLAADTEYAVVALPTSPEFEIFTTTLGEFQLSNPNQRQTTQPYLGQMFKSQNQKSWTTEQTQDILMRLHKCVFESAGAVLSLNIDTPGNLIGSPAIAYDIFYADGEMLDFSSTNIDFALKPSIEQAPGVYTVDPKTYQYQLGQNTNLGQRKIFNPGDATSLQFACAMSQKNINVSPVIDVNRLTLTVIENDINSNTSGEDQLRVYTLTHVTGTTTELVFKLDSGHLLEVGDRVYVLVNTKNSLQSIYTIVQKTSDTITVTRVEATGNFTETVDTGTITRFGQCYSKYVSRTVTLKPDFYSDDLSVSFNANIPNGCDIIPMYRVTLPDDTNILDEIWHPMAIDYTGSISPNGFREYKYRTTYTDAGEHYALESKDLFSQFAVKLLIMSINPAVVPLVKDLRVITLNA